MSDDMTNIQQATEAEAAAQTTSVTGRSVFMIRTGSNGIEVLPGLLVDEKEVLKADAVVFPDLGYALEQIDAMRNLVLQHFGAVARVGVQVLSQLPTQESDAADPASGGAAEVLGEDKDV